MDVHNNKKIVENKKSKRFIGFIFFMHDGRKGITDWALLLLFADYTSSSTCSEG
jgi:hypothetical protein